MRGRILLLTLLLLTAGCQTGPAPERGKAKEGAKAFVGRGAPAVKAACISPGALPRAPPA